MAFENRMILSIASGLLLVCSVLYITANILPTWGTMTDKSGKTTIGLWKFCLSTNAMSICDDILIVIPPDMHAKPNIISARAFVTISCILSSLSVIFILLILLIKEDLKTMMNILAKVLSIGSLIAGIISIAIGISLIRAVKFDIGVSSILAIIAVVFNLGGCILTLIIK